MLPFLHVSFIHLILIFFRIFRAPCHAKHDTSQVEVLDEQQAVELFTMLQVSCLCDVTKAKYGDLSDFCVLSHVLEYTTQVIHFHTVLIFHTFERRSWRCRVCAFGQFKMRDLALGILQPRTHSRRQISEVWHHGNEALVLRIFGSRVLTFAICVPNIRSISELGAMARHVAHSTWTCCASFAMLQCPGNVGAGA